MTRPPVSSGLRRFQERHESGQALAIKGYATPATGNFLVRLHGRSPIHRYSFRTAFLTVPSGRAD